LEVDILRKVLLVNLHIVVGLELAVLVALDSLQTQVESLLLLGHLIRDFLWVLEHHERIHFDFGAFQVVYGLTGLLQTTAHPLLF
jgi:hypothetical protein